MEDIVDCWLSISAASPDEVQYPLITSSEGALTSLGYPFGYKPSVRSVWTVAPPAGHATKIVFTRIDLGTGNCDALHRDLLIFEEIPLDDSPKTSTQISCTVNLLFCYVRQIIVHVYELRRYSAERVEYSVHALYRVVTRNMLGSASQYGELRSEKMTNGS